MAGSEDKTGCKHAVRKCGFTLLCLGTAGTLATRAGGESCPHIMESRDPKAGQEGNAKKRFISIYPMISGCY